MRECRQILRQDVNEGMNNDECHVLSCLTEYIFVYRDRKIWST